MYIKLFPNKVNYNLYNNLDKNNISIFAYRFKKNEPIYPIDVLAIKYKEIDKYSILATLITFIIVHIFLKFIIYYYIMYWFFYIIYLFWYLNVILYKITTTNKEYKIELQLEYLNSWNISIWKIIELIHDKNIKIKSFLTVYFILSNKQKKIELKTIFKKIFFSKLFLFPLWILNPAYFLYDLLYVSLMSIDFKEKKINFYISIYLYEIRKRLPVKINAKYSNILMYSNSRAIIINKWNIKTNSLIEKLTQKFLAQEILKSTEYSEYISKIHQISHRITPFSKIDAKKEFQLVKSYTTKCEIRLNETTTLENLNQKNKTNIKNIIFKSNYEGLPNQNSLITMLPTKVIKQSQLDNFFVNNLIYNESQYRAFKICERASLIKEGSKFIDNINENILMQNSNLSLFISFDELKKKNLISNETLKFIYYTIPENMAELYEFIDKEILLISNKTKHNNKDIAKLIIESLDNMTFNKKLRTDAILNGLFLENSNHEEREYVRLLYTSENYTLNIHQQF